MRIDGRNNNELRDIKFTRRFTEKPKGSVLVEFGKTRVLCTVMIEESVPPFLFNSGKGWITAEYSMLPGASHQRKQRDSRRGSVDGRSLEIGRLVGRCLRAIARLDALGQRTLWVDCDVLQADGGTRTAAITGAYVALHDALMTLKRRNLLQKGWPLRSSVAAVSIGLIKSTALVDLNYQEDSQAEMDMNIVMTGKGEFVEIQGTAEKNPFTASQLSEILELAKGSIEELTTLQFRSLGIEKDGTSASSGI